MPTWGDFFSGFDWTSLLTFLFTAAAALVCITLHELAHGFAAWKLGDPTAKNAGRLTLNPIRHLDVLGLLMLVTVHVGWAKPVPVDTRYFKNPRRDMAFVALAGPLTNFLIAFIALLGCRLIYDWEPGGVGFAYLLLALMYLAVLSLGLGVFNLIPIPPLDGSKILMAFLPGRVAAALHRRERQISLALLLLVWLGLLDGPLGFLREGAMKGLCALSGFPFEVMAYFFF